MVDDRGSSLTFLSGAWRSIYFWLLVGCLLTVFAMWVHAYLPDKRLQLVQADTEAYIYADSRNHVEWQNMEELSWSCQIEETYSDAFCGFTIVLAGEDGSGKDFTQFSEIRLDLSYSGPASLLRYYFRNREPGFSQRDNPETNKFMQTQIALEFLEGGLAIALDEFYVAEWWLSQFEVPREFSRPDFSNVTALGIDLPSPILAGDHRLQLHSAELVGDWVSREQWYASIMVVWLVALVTAGVIRMIQLRQSVLRERRRLAELASRNRELLSQSARFRDLSRKDQLTGLLNRHGAVEAIEDLFSAPETLVSLLVIDIDHFKPVNDSHGHDVGDGILAEMGRLLQDNIRRSDYAARWGGEEFIVLLPETDEAGARMIAEKLRRLIAGSRFEALPEVPITVSLGVGQRQPDEPYHQLFQRVDMALYRAKERGRNQTAAATIG